MKKKNILWNIEIYGGVKNIARNEAKGNTAINIIVNISEETKQLELEANETQINGKENSGKKQTQKYAQSS